MPKALVQHAVDDTFYKEGKKDIDKESGCLQSAVCRDINGKMCGRKSWGRKRGQSKKQKKI